MIHFNRPVINEDILSEVKKSIMSETSRGDGPYCKLCDSWIEEHFEAKKALLTGSCSHALELAALLCNIGPGDEVIMPSYTFCSTANAFALRGAKIVIYGAGVVGQSYYLCLSDKYNVVAWIDKEKDFAQGQKIDRVEILKSISYDCIVIAVKEKKTAQEISNGLIQLGVKDEQIIWQKPKVSSWAFYASDNN